MSLLSLSWRQFGRRQRRPSISCSVLSHPSQPHWAWRWPLSACTDPYDPGQRAVGGGLLGAGAGAAIGGLAGGGRGAAAGALIGGAVGAVGGAATTPQPSAAGLLRAAASGLLPAATAAGYCPATEASANAATGAPRTGASARNRPPSVGCCRSALGRAPFAQRRHIEVAFGEARHGRVRAPGTAACSAARPVGEKRLRHAGGGAGRPVGALHIHRGAVRPAVLVGQRGQHAMAGQRAGVRRRSPTPR